VRKVLESCLEKQPSKRLRGDVWRLLESARELRLLPQRGRRSWLGWGVAALLAVGLGTIAFQRFQEKPLASATTLRFQITAPENTVPGQFNVSPDGHKLAFIAGDPLWVHSLESGVSNNLTDANGRPLWSRDSRFIAYRVAQTLKKIESTGGPPQTVMNLQGPGGGGAWNQDDLIVFSVGGAFFRVPASGGVPVQITALDPARQEASHYSPSFLPDGRYFVYTRVLRDQKNSEVFVGSVDAKPGEQSSKPLVNSISGAQYAPSADRDAGYLLFMREDTLMAQPFDNRRLELTGQATPVAEQIGGNSFSVSSNNVLVFQRDVASERLTWYDREGKVLGTIGDLGDYVELALSPDGTRLAFSKRIGQAVSIWLMDLSRDTSTRFTFGSGNERVPLWSPDGSRIVFTSDDDLYQRPVSGVKDAEVLLKSAESVGPASWSRDGRLLLYTLSR
jgi:tricorn protease-like protein